MYDGFGMSQVATDVLDRRLSKPLVSCVGAHLGGRLAWLDKTMPETQES